MWRCWKIGSQRKKGAMMYTEGRMLIGTLTSNWTGVKHGVLYTICTSNTSPRPLDRKRRSLEKLLVRVLLVQCKLVECPFRHLLYNILMALEELVFGISRIIDKRFVLRKINIRKGHAQYSDLDVPSHLPTSSSQNTYPPQQQDWPWLAKI